jgi:hypothetical protein
MLFLSLWHGATVTARRASGELDLDCRLALKVGAEPNVPAAAERAIPDERVGI